MTTFLRNPAEISGAVRELQKGERIDLAVAFIGKHWRDLLSDYAGPLRVICWLSSTNTDPYAVEQLKKRRFTQIKQRDSLHCKVYLSPGKGAVVGSANLSKAALNDTLDEDGISGQHEAAVKVTAASMVDNVEQWFRNLWKHPETRPISRGDLNVAQRAYDKAKAVQRKNSQNARVGSNGSIPLIPKSFHPEILRYAKKVRGLDLRTDLGEAHDFVSSIEPSKLISDEREALVDYVAAWTGHPSAYKRFLNEPISKARAGLELLFDDSANLQSRLEQIQKRSYFPGFRMRSMSVVLYWRQPDHFLPYNFRTGKFLARFGLRSRGMSASSPKCYLTWLAWATSVGQRLGLPSVGYVDRIVDRWYSDQSDAE